MLTQMRDTKAVKLMDRWLQRFAPTAMTPCATDVSCRRQPVGWVYSEESRQSACGRHMRLARRSGRSVEYWVV